MPCVNYGEGTVLRERERERVCVRGQCGERERECGRVGTMMGKSVCVRGR